MSKVIVIENLSKLYRLGEIGTGTLSHDLNRWWKTRILGREDPYAKLGQVNDRTVKGADGEHVWALKGINMEIEQGDVVGIIGKNGAGKSTLLKILSRVTSPSEGEITINGRLVSLLEVGTGFHPEMTGRENIFMNGTIMGMRKWEVTRKLDEIVEFAGVSKYLDTPVKRYSSGMTVRLGFAVAAHLESEIMLVDEVLAVGDAEFQKKAVGKMNQISTGEGRTILFVSHNMSSIRSICRSGVLLEQGQVFLNSSANEVVDSYESSFLLPQSGRWVNNEAGNISASLESIEVHNASGSLSSMFSTDENIYVKIFVSSRQNMKGVKVGFDLLKQGQVIFRTQQVDSTDADHLQDGKKYCFQCKIPRWFLNQGNYYVRPLFSIHGLESLTTVYDIVLGFSVRINPDNSHYHRLLNESNHPGAVFPLLEWNVADTDDE